MIAGSKCFFLNITAYTFQENSDVLCTLTSIAFVYMCLFIYTSDYILFYIFI